MTRQSLSKPSKKGSSLKSKKSKKRAKKRNKAHKPDMSVIKEDVDQEESHRTDLSLDKEGGSSDKVKELPTHLQGPY